MLWRTLVVFLFLGVTSTVFATEEPVKSEAPAATKTTAPAEQSAEPVAEDEASAVEQPSTATVTSEPEVLSGKIIGVANGDTLTLLVGRTPTVVWVYGIDAPEEGQPYSTVAKRRLTASFAGKQAEVLVKSRDEKTGLVYGVVSTGNTNVAQQMLRAGLAWHVPEQSDDKSLAKLEAAARRAKRGLWRDEHPVPPWEWRAASASQQAALATDRDKPAAEKPANDAEAPVAMTPELGNQKYWLNIRSNVRHNRQCEWFGTTSQGRYCAANEGRPCGGCGG